MANDPKHRRSRWDFFSVFVRTRGHDVLLAGTVFGIVVGLAIVALVSQLGAS